MTKREWKGAAILGVVVVGLTVLFNVIPVNGQLAIAIILAVVGIGSGWVANMEPDPPIGPRAR